MCNCKRRQGDRCVGNNQIQTLIINQWADLRDLELRGNGGCAGGNVSDQDGNVYRVGGGGGNGGGGLWISAHGYSINNMTFDTSGSDGQPGTDVRVSGFLGRTTACGGAGAGGNAGRIVLVYDGGLATVANPNNFTISTRGRSPSKTGRCTGLLGDTNSNRSETPVQIAPLNCK
jgi:hypothetical protein